MSSGTRWALMHELRGAPEPGLDDLLAKMSPVDLVVVEGYKAGPHRRIEVHRAANGKPLLFPEDAGIACGAMMAMSPVRFPIARELHPSATFRRQRSSRLEASGCGSIVR